MKHSATPAHAPEAAVAAFKDRGLLAPTFNWWDVWQDEHASAFMVAGMAERDVLQLVREGVDEALRTGKSLKDFMRDLKPALQAAGWWGDVAITDPATGEQRVTRFDDARLRLILDTNLRQNNAAGRWEATQRSKARRPYLMDQTMRDSRFAIRDTRVRPLHAAWDGLVLPVDDPFWHTHYPPNGWRCRCRAVSVSERDLRRDIADGERITTPAPPVQTVRYLDKRTGLEADVPAGIVARARR